MKIILATTSPYRKEAFAFLGIPFEAEGSKVDESQVKRRNPEDLVKQLSKLKAEAVAKNYADAVVIGLDSVGFFEGKILEKPKSKEKGFERLKSLSGNNFQFYTGIYMINTAENRFVENVVKTDAFLRNISDDEINKYLSEDQNYNTYALGFDPLCHSSSSFIQKIEGSYNNLLRGIPLEVVPEMLREAGNNNF
ncbi:MAG: Maf family nucleotide pyrophosphatase [Candidatus Pacebacteria bacterium]|nr:Maf family nucleotide pyrophosphatase [Candidatus Paceibacterota bacterium]